jgi:hypothetical protein
MAQTKTKKASRSSSGKTKPAKAKSGRKPKASQARAKRTRTRAQSSQGAKSKASPSNGLGQAVGNAGKDASHATSQAVSKARIPLLAGGAALAGTVGGVVFGATRSGGKVLGVKLPEPKRVKIRSKDLAKAAKEVGRFGENVGDLTTELRRAREGLANGEGGHNSPIEVLLKGLTHRH